MLLIGSARDQSGGSSLVVGYCVHLPRALLRSDLHGERPVGKVYWFSSEVRIVLGKRLWRETIWTQDLISNSTFREYAFTSTEVKEIGLYT